MLFWLCLSRKNQLLRLPGLAHPVIYHLCPLRVLMDVVVQVLFPRHSNLYRNSGCIDMAVWWAAPLECLK